MADYAGQASAIYDPQLAAETATLGQTKAVQDQALATDTTSTNTAYTDALSAAGKTRDANQSKADFTLSTHNLWQSGLAANEARLVGQNYSDNATKIETARAAKLADIAGKKQLNDSGYATNLGNLKSKYGGLKSTYVIDHQNADAAAAAKAAAAASRVSARAPSARENQTAFNQDLMSAFDTVSNGGGYKPGAREKVAQALATNYGIPLPSAQAQVNSVFTDSWDEQMKQNYYSQFK